MRNSIPYAVRCTFSLSAARIDHPKSKEVLLYTRFGSLSIAKRFRLKDMLYQGKFEL